jgi:ABC-2 type transport system ATP-binding protein
MTSRLGPVTTSTADPLVHIENFRMDFGKTTVIRDLSFDVGRGETFGFLGSNGSGKTTTIRALLGIYQPTAGTLHIGGRPFRPENADRLGYLPEERGLYKKESVIDVMTYFGMLKGLGRDKARSWSLEYLQKVNLAEKEKVRLDKLSGGQQQKIQLGVTIMNDPELLILDEPTKGFDPVNRRLVMDIIDDAKKAGATVIMVTHQMEEVERLCDRVILLKDGMSRAYGTVTQVQDSFGGTLIHVEHDGTVPASSAYTIASDRDGHAQLDIPAGADTAAILHELVTGGLTVRAFTPVRKSLDDIFVEVYGDEEAGQE